MSHTFKLMLHESHRIVLFASVHRFNARAEAGDWKNNDVADLLWLLHSGEMGVGDVALAGAHVEIGWVVEEGEDAVGPKTGAGELNDAFVVLCEFALCLALQSFLGNIGNHIDEDGMAGLRLDGPLAELNATGVPVGPVRAIRISLDADDHAVRIAGHIVRNPISGTLQRVRVDVGVDATPRKEDQVAEEVCFEDGDG